MKVNTATREVETSAEVVHQSFRIGDTSKMFGILADKIYSDKPRAVIREISCNALDAHNAIGNTSPFKISTPSPLEPMFTVRDFGPGLSHEDVIGLYTTFFDSTKSGGNDQIGGFGLGSKSPFAYTDAFTVTAYQQGEKRVYAAFRGTDNVPQISLATTENTNDPDGLEVRVPVRKEDIAVFQATARDVLQWFPEGSFESFGFTVPTVEWLIKTERWGIRLGMLTVNHYGGDTTPRVALMGPVGYALDWKMVYPHVNPLPAAIVPFFEIGELDLPPSRETLSYDPATIAKLKEVGELIKAELPLLAHKMGKAMDPWDQCTFVTKIKTLGLATIIAKVCNSTHSASYCPEPFSDMAGGIILRGTVDAFETSYRSDNLIRNKTQAKDYIYKFGDQSKIVFDDLPGEAPGKKRTLSRLRYDGGRRYLLVNNGKQEYSDFEHLKKTFGKAPDLSFLTKLSDYEIPTVSTFASSAAYQMRLCVSRGGSGFWEDGAKPNPGDIWWPLNGHEVEEEEDWLKIAPFLTGISVFGLTKTARKAFDTTQMVRADVHVADKLAKLEADPANIEWVKNKLMIREFFRELNEDGNDDIRLVFEMLRARDDNGQALFPNLAAEIAKVGGAPASGSGDLLLVAVDNGKVTAPSFKKNTKIIPLLRQVYNDSPLVQLAVQMRQDGRMSMLAMAYDAHLQKMV